LQRVLDALITPKKDPSAKVPAGPVLQESGKDDEFVTQPKMATMSNITSIVVSPGFTVPEVGGLLLYRFSKSSSFPLRLIRVIVYYVLIYPIIIIFTKSTSFAAESVLYTLFLPHSHKISPAFEGAARQIQEADRRTIEGGMLYRDYAVVRLPGDAEETIMNSEGIGRAVWEYFEAGVKRWEKEEAENLAEIVKENTSSPHA